MLFIKFLKLSYFFLDIVKMLFWPKLDVSRTKLLPASQQDLRFASQRNKRQNNENLFNFNLTSKIEKLMYNIIFC